MCVVKGVDDARAAKHVQRQRESERENGEQEGGASEGGQLVIVEVTVSSKPDAVREQKRCKYADLAPLLARSAPVRRARLAVPDPFLVVLADSGHVPPSTLATLATLALCTAGPLTPRRDGSAPDAQAGTASSGQDSENVDGGGDGAARRREAAEGDARRLALQLAALAGPDRV